MVAIAFKSRVEHRKQLELEKARKAGLAAAEVDDDGNQINPHIPHYLSSAPWYLNAQKPSLKHQRKWKPAPNYAKSWYHRGATVYQANKYRTGACENCGAMSHTAKSCTERPRKSGAKWTGKHIAPDEKIEQLELDYDGKRYRWNGYDSAASYALVVERYEARTKHLKEEQVKKLDEDLEDESKQQIKITGTTVRNLRIREDTAKYLLNLDPNSAHYDPKTRSMREDPLPDMDPKDKFYAGDNHNRLSGEALELLKHLHIHMQSEAALAPSQAELIYKSYRISKERLESQRRDTILEKYGNAANEETLSPELLLGQSDIQVEYDRYGRIVKEDEEDVYINNHTSVWGSWWKENVWGYKCCKQIIRNTYCTLGR